MGRSRGAGLGKQLAAVGAQGRAAHTEQKTGSPGHGAVSHSQSAASQRPVSGQWQQTRAQCWWSSSSMSCARGRAAGSSLARLACHRRISSRQPRAP